MHSVHHIHFVGIKGVGMAPLAVIAKEAGFVVTGSDVATGFITDSMLLQAGITPFVGFEKDHVQGADMVITTGAHGGYDNVEVITAKEKSIPVMTQGQAVGAFMQGELLGKSSQVGISVAGTHGKTTTTAMVATLLNATGNDPSWVIGTSEIPSLGVSGHFGKGTYFVAEADEYANEPTHDKTPKLLLQHPHIAVITNIEHDHPDVYATVDDLQKTMLAFANNLSDSGVLIAYGDDARVVSVLGDYHGRKITYGVLPSNEYILIKLSSHTYEVTHNGEKVATLTLRVLGEHNGLNALAALLVGKVCGVGFAEGAGALGEFTGTKRRMEYIGQLPSGALLYDDYAHHPTEITKSLLALRQHFPGKKIVCLFQPHTFSRTKLLFDDFIDSLSHADTVVLSEIYPSAREEKDPSVASSQIVEALTKRGKQAALAQTLENMIQYIRQQHYGDETIVVTMGAGDIYTIAKEILEHESAPSES